MKRTHGAAFRTAANTRPQTHVLQEPPELEVANPLDTSGIEDDVDRRVLAEVDRAVSFLDDPMPVLLKTPPETKPSYYILHYNWGPVEYMLDFDRFGAAVRDIPQVRKTAIGKRGLYIHVARHSALARARRQRQVARERRGPPAYEPAGGAPVLAPARPATAPSAPLAPPPPRPSQPFSDGIRLG
jgi:hypothetical protein